MRRKLTVDGIYYSKMLRLFAVYLVIFIMRCIGSPTVNKCYVCGPESEQPFLDEKFTKVSGQIQNTCGNFDQLPEHAKAAYAIECPKEYRGCMTKVGQQVTRTCTNVAINDCRTVNDDHICICDNNLCNGEKPKGMGNLHIYNEDDTEEESDENDQESGDGDNYESIHTTLKHDQSIDSSIARTTENHHNIIIADDDDDVTTEKFNEFVKVSVSTMQPSINSAVNFNLSRLLLFINCAIFSAMSYLNSSKFM